MIMIVMMMTIMIMIMIMIDHSGGDQLSRILVQVTNRAARLVVTEEQMMFLFHLVGPFLQRLSSEGFMKQLCGLTVILYEILMRMDAKTPQLKNLDVVCDFLYHIKYQFIGNSVRHNVEKIIRQLSKPLQFRLRFITKTEMKTEAMAVEPRTLGHAVKHPEE